MTSTQTHTSNLRLTVTDFGPLARADFDLRPLTVFVGPSNTGKSYLAILLYALHQSVGHNVATLPQKIQHWQESNTHSTSYDSEFVSRLLAWTHQVSSEAITAKKFETRPIEVPEFVGQKLRPRLRDRTLLGLLFTDEIKRCFGIENTEVLKRHSSSASAKIVLERSLSPHREPFKHQFTLSQASSPPVVSIPDDLPLHLYPTSQEWYFRLSRFSAMAGILPRIDRGDIWDAFVTHDLFISLLDANALGPLNAQAHYLPADRTGIMHAHGLAVSASIERASRVGLQRETPSPLLSGVLADFLVTLISLANESSERDPVLAKEIEDSLLGGSIHIDKSITDYPVFTYQPKGWKASRAMPLMRTSSMVSELAPVFLYLRYILEMGNVLIIEEPESHLHPSMQVDFIRFLARVVQAGVRVIITTHSEWVLEELANLVRLSDLPEEDRQEVHGAESALNPNEVGVWLFEHKGRYRGSTLKEIPLDVEFGGFRSEFDRVAIQTYSDWANIANRISGNTDQ